MRGIGELKKKMYWKRRFRTHRLGAVHFSHVLKILIFALSVHWNWALRFLFFLQLFRYRKGFVSKKCYEELISQCKIKYYFSIRSFILSYFLSIKVTHLTNIFVELFFVDSNDLNPTNWFVICLKFISSQSFSSILMTLLTVNFDV